MNTEYECNVQSYKPLEVKYLMCNLENCVHVLGSPAFLYIICIINKVYILNLIFKISYIRYF